MVDPSYFHLFWPRLERASLWDHQLSGIPMSSTSGASPAARRGAYGFIGGRRGRHRTAADGGGRRHRDRGTARGAVEPLGPEERVFGPGDSPGV